MTDEEILKGLYDNTLIGNAPEVKQLTEQGVADGLDPESMLYDALIPSLEEVGARFERGDFFVPEMLIAARAMQGALDILRPLHQPRPPGQEAVAVDLGGGARQPPSPARRHTQARHRRDGAGLLP